MTILMSCMPLYPTLIVLSLHAHTAKVLIPRKEVCWELEKN